MKHEKISLTCEQILEKIKLTLQLNKKIFSFKPDTCEIFESKKHYALKVDVNFQLKDQKDEVSQTVVIKYFNPRIRNYLERWSKERENYQTINELIDDLGQSSRIHIPKLIYACPGILMLEFIEGESIDSLLNDQMVSKNILETFAKWLVVLHENNLIFGDQRLNHFLYTSNQEIFAVDLEDICQGDPNEDLGYFLEAFLDSHSMIFTNSLKEYNVQCMMTFLKCYLKNQTMNNWSDWNPTNFDEFWVSNIIEKLKIIANRRELMISDEKWEQIQSDLLDYFKNFDFSVIHF